jgi:hypothetical protein
MEEGAMLRITINRDEKTKALRLEGRLAGEWINELRNCWEQLPEISPAIDMKVDLTGVTWVSDEGKELLAMMHRQGAELVTADVLMSAIVAEIVESAPSQSTEERGR